MSRKTRKYATGLGSVPLTPADNNGYESPRELSTRLRREEAEEIIKQQTAAEEKLMAPVRAAEREFKQEASKQSAKVKAFYSKPLAVINDNTDPDDNLDLAPVDLFGDYPLLEGPRDPQAESAAGKEFEQNLESSGCTLTAAGWIRLGHYIGRLRRHRGVSFASATSWMTALGRLFSLGCFAAGELSGYAEMVAAQQARKPKPAKPEPTFDDLASQLSTQSDAGNKALKIAAVDAALTGPIREMWSAFAESLYRNFNGFVFTEKQKCVFHEAMKERRMNWLRPTDYDLVRVALVRSHDLPAHLIYPKEQLAIDMETADMSKPEVWREFNRRERQLSA
jgi:hypothetical protein